MNLLDDLKRLLESYTQPCISDCDHSQCPLLRELHVLRIKASLEQARLTVKPIVDKEKQGEQIGDLMNMRLNTHSDNQPALQPPERIILHPDTLEQMYGHIYLPKDKEAGDIEYARVTRSYFCSCGGALTAEEYIEHYFGKGHDRGI